MCQTIAKGSDEVVPLWLLFDGQMLPKVVAELSLLYAPVKELQHVLPELCLSLRREDPVRLHLFGELYQFTETCLLSLLVVPYHGRELVDQREGLSPLLLNKCIPPWPFQSVRPRSSTANLTAL